MSILFVVKLFQNQSVIRQWEYLSLNGIIFIDGQTDHLSFNVLIANSLAVNTTKMQLLLFKNYLSIQLAFNKSSKFMPLLSSLNLC